MEENAIYIVNANKSLSGNKILNNVTIKVPRGCIYGLLGASGCGKTTLLNCVVGRMKLTSGDIFVLGSRPGSPESGVPGPRVGYMPQDIALMADFTINDSIFFFGRIQKMADNLIKERFQVLKQMLNLPPDNRLLKNCSGGEKRRVSFAVALIHKPELLILDEPTVGLDPVLRATLWNYLAKIAQEEGTSILITTHYIEEARQANKVGLLRGGKLLAEDSPDGLLQRFHTDNLEEVFLALCKHQEERQNILEESHESLVNSTTVKQKNHSTAALSFNKHHMKSLVSKNLKQLVRSPGNVFYICIIPILETLCIIFGIGGVPRNIPMAVVNNEITNNCQDYSQMGTAVPFSDSECQFTNLSCRFINDLEDSMFQFSTYDNIEYAREDMRHGKVRGLIYIAHNFSDAFSNRINSGRLVSADDIDFGEIVVWMDKSAGEIGDVIKRRLGELFQNFLASTFIDCGFFEKFAKFPMRFEFEYGTNNEPFINFILPGALITSIFYLCTLLTCTLLITDRLEGIWDRCMVAGVSSLEIVTAHCITQFGAVLLQISEIILTTFVACGIDFAGEMWIIFLLLFCQGICGMCLGLFASVIANTYFIATFIATGIFLPMVCTAGIIWPLEAQPDILRYTSYMQPFTIPSMSLRQIMKKGYGFKDITVISGFGITLIWITLLLLLSIIVIKVKST